MIIALIFFVSLAYIVTTFLAYAQVTTTPGGSGPTFRTFSVPIVPSAPQNLSATGGNAQVSLTWKAPSFSGSSAITGYNIYRGTTPGGESSIPLGNTTRSTTAYTDKIVTNAQTYYYKVKAVNSVGVSPASNEASATPQALATAPAAPRGLSATAVSTSQINLSWISPSSNGGSAITGYKIERSTDGGTTWSTTVENTTTTTAYSDIGLNPNTAYTYRVSAINVVGTSPPSSTASSTTQSAATAPSTPQNLAVTSSNAQVSLSWMAPTSNGGSTITGYNVYRGTTPGGESAMPIATGVTITSYIDTDRTNGQIYYYTVTAVNSIGTSGPSNEESATPSAPSTQPSTTPPSTQPSTTSTSNSGYTTGTISGFSDSSPVDNNPTITVVDKDMSGSSSVSVHVWSYTDPAGISINLIETPAGSGSFQGIVYFSTTDQSSGNTLRVTPDDKVQATYLDQYSTISTLPTTITMQTYITGNSNKPLPPPITNIFTITVSIDKVSYTTGDTVVISGQVSNFSPAVPVSVEVVDPYNSLVHASQANIDANGRYSTSLLIGTEGLLKIPGPYTVRAYYGNDPKPAEAHFYFEPTKIFLTTTANPSGGTYTTTQTVTLTSNYPSTIYYTTDGSDPSTSSSSGQSPLTLPAFTSTTILKFFAADGSGNKEPIQTENYVVSTPPSPPTEPESNTSFPLIWVLPAVGGIAATGGGLLIATKSGLFRHKLVQPSDNSQKKSVDHNKKDDAPRSSLPYPRVEVRGDFDD